MNTTHLLIAVSVIAAGAVAFAIRMAGLYRATAHAYADAQAELTLSAGEINAARRARNIAFEALRFYAADPSWRPNGRRKHSLVFRDRGEVARAALSGESAMPIVARLVAAQEAAIEADRIAAEAAAATKVVVDDEKQKITEALAGVEGGAP